MASPPFAADDVLSPKGVRQTAILGNHLGQLSVSFDRCLSGAAPKAYRKHRVVTLLHRRPACELEIDPTFNEFDTETLIHRLLQAILANKPDVLQILHNPQGHRAAPSSSCSAACSSATARQPRHPSTAARIWSY